MAGTWTITDAAISSWAPSANVASPVGQTFEVGPHRSGDPSLVEVTAFGWLPGVEPPQGLTVFWARNDGDGKLLLFGFDGAYPGVGPATVGWTPNYSLGIALGSRAPDQVVGQFVENPGHLTGGTVFQFTATRNP